MTSFVGKWKLLVLVLCCGYLAFAKAESPPHTAHNIFSSSQVATFSINKNTTRSEIFDLFKELFLSHSIKAKLDGYKRHAGVITLLDLTLTDENGENYPLKLENSKGIDDACLTINAAQNSIVEFATCMEAQDAVVPIAASEMEDVKAVLSTKDSNDIVSSRSVAQEVVAARKSQTELEIESARLREKQKQEERRLDVLERKAKVETQIEETRRKNQELANDRAAKREQQLQEVRDRQLAKKQELEAARIAKLEEEKRQIAIETARFEAQAQAERDRLAELEKERLAAQQRQDQLRLEEENAKKEAQRLKQEEKEKAREIERVRKRLESERLAQVKADKERVKAEKEALERKRLERELELEKLSQERKAAQAALDAQLRKEQEVAAEKRRKERELRENELIDEQERYRGESADAYQRRALMLNANEEDFIPEEEKIIEQGFLIFNAEQCSYKVFMGKTMIYDAFGKKILTIEDELIDAPQTGKVMVNGIPATYEFTSNLLIVKNSKGELIDENGKVVGAGVSTAAAVGVSFKATQSFKCLPQSSKEEVMKIFKKIESHDFNVEVLELTHNREQLISGLVFRIDDESFSYNNTDGISTVIIEINDERKTVRVRSSN